MGIMKKIIAILLSLSLCGVLFGCGNDNVNLPAESTSENSTKQNRAVTETITESTTETTTPIPEMLATAMKYRAEYGKKTGTDKTYTGLEPLEKRDFPVVDPNNLRSLGTKAINHSYGISENGVPHEISVNNQTLYEKYDGLCLDTSGEKSIYLTFDCGYENGYTGKILDVLKEKKIPAAFFVTYPYVTDNPELTARMINEGHTVGNHSVNHPNFSCIDRTRMVDEIKGLDDCLREKFGYSAPFFRFPEGACSESALDVVQTIGYQAVFWSSAYADWDTQNFKGKEYAFNTVTSRLHPGCVLLLHAVSKDNADALGDIIDYAMAQGYIFKSLEK